MVGSKVLQQNIVQRITLPALACLRPMMHPGTISSTGNRHTCTQPSTWCKRRRNVSDQASSLVVLPETHHSPLQEGNTQQDGNFGEVLTKSSSHYNLFLFKVTQILMFDCFSCLQHNVEDKMFPYCLYSTQWQVPLQQDNQCFLLSVVICYSWSVYIPQVLVSRSYWDNIMRLSDLLYWWRDLNLYGSFTSCLHMKVGWSGVWLISIQKFWYFSVTISLFASSTVKTKTGCS